MAAQCPECGRFRCSCSPASDKPPDPLEDGPEPVAVKGPSARLSMNTAQLIVLWYAGLIIIAMLAFKAIESSSAGFPISGVVLLAALLIYTLKPHPHARKRWVLAGVGGPLVLAALGLYFWLHYESGGPPARRRSLASIPHEQVDVVSPRLSGYGGLSGRLRNRSPLTVEVVALRISAFDGADKIAEGRASIEISVPSGEARDFNSHVSGLPSLPAGFRWEYRVVEVLGARPGG
jgi:hypothetical protein